MMIGGHVFEIGTSKEMMEYGVDFIATKPIKDVTGATSLPKNRTMIAIDCEMVSEYACTFYE